MTNSWQVGGDLALLLVGYWLIDTILRQGRLQALVGRLGCSTRAQWSAVWGGLGFALWPLSPWEALPEAAPLRLLGGGLCVALAWRAATRDFDVVAGERARWPRAALFVCALGSFLSPATMVSCVVLLSCPFGMWQHHATLPMRVLQALVAFVGLSALFGPLGMMQGAASFVLLAIIIQVSHYLITALAKGYLGPHWYSWVVDNRLHHLGASAYSWGWACFIPWPRWRSLLRAVARFERPLQGVVFAVELLAPLALLHPDLAVGLGLAWAGFHLGVFALSGLLFWEWIVTDVLLALMVGQLQVSTAATAFGAWPLLMGTLVLAAFPLRHRLWKPMPLGWWDTPFTQRMHWVVRGQSGRRYGLYANTMEPHERIYGKVHGFFLAPVPVLTYHLGEAFRHELRDGLRDAQGDPARLDALRAGFGIQPRSEQLAARHEAYLRRFCWELNQGARKAVLPSTLAWLKAPGGQCFNWGELPAYRRQEPIRELEILYREEYFDGDALLRLREQPVLKLEIEEGSPPPPAASEPTPKQLDDLLLTAAAGRLIRLPGLGGGYVDGDDGKAVVVSTSQAATP